MLALIARKGGKRDSVTLARLGGRRLSVRKMR